MGVQVAMLYSFDIPPKHDHIEFPKNNPHTVSFTKVPTLGSSNFRSANFICLKQLIGQSNNMKRNRMNKSIKVICYKQIKRQIIT